MRTADESDGITFKRCAIAGAWSFIVIIIAGSLLDHPVGQFFMFPLVGLPWLFFVLADKERKKEPMGAGEAAATIFGGSFISVFCAVPVVFVVMMLKKLFH